MIVVKSEIRKKLCVLKKKKKKRKRQKKKKNKRNGKEMNVKKDKKIYKDVEMMHEK